MDRYLYYMNFESLLMELIMNPVDQERLDKRGEILLDSLEVGPYKAVLLKNKNTDFIQIGLTSYDNLFTNPEDQLDKPSHESHKMIVLLWKSLTSKIKEWVKEYGTIHGGSSNHGKTEKYRKIFMRYGLNCGEIFTRGRDTGFTIHPSESNV